MLTHEDYTVGWICALPVEMTAAKTMLDETHPALVQRSTDPNTYTLGRIGSHNVVIACLPFGVYGTTSSSNVAAHMLSTFPQIQFGVMVGIGGGVPTKEADIRLGDVVVSKPTGTSGGVVQYDYGKMMAGGRFQHMGTLNQPPTILLTSLSQLQSDYGSMKYQPLSRIVTEALERNHHLGNDFSYPGQENDQLFQSEYDHQYENGDCTECDKQHLVKRQPRRSQGEHTYIHYGLIASGNQVMKDGRTRDRFARELGVLCFEMEAAGLMNHMPCLVIRGICDYSDSHKQKKWQGYAALIAAAYGKLLLSIVPMTAPKTKLAEKTELTDEEHLCLRDLFLTDPAEDKNLLKRRKGDRAPGTGKWMLETVELNRWLGSEKKINSGPNPNILWLYGNPGNGKTTMAITIVEELPDELPFKRSDGILSYFFCDSNVEERRSATGVLRGILYQWIKQRPQLMQFLLPKFRERKQLMFKSFDSLWSIMLEIGRDSESGNKYCIIDALDECDSESQQMLLAQISQDYEGKSIKKGIPHLHIMITSRPYPEIGRYLTVFNHKDLASYENIKKDLEIFISEKVKDLSQRNRYSDKIGQQIHQIIREKAEGTFLWVGIASAELATIRSRDAVKKLQSLPRGLHSLYGKLLDVALQHDEEDHKTIIQMLGFVATARRPLRTAELAEACEQYQDEDEETRLRFIQEDIEMCRLMIIIQDGIVRLLHKSVKDFLLGDEGHNLIDELKAHATLANRCIDEILRYSRETEQRRNKDQKKVFLNYATVFWPEHAALAQTRFTLLESHESFFKLDSQERERWLELYKRYRIFADTPKGFSIFHVAARWGIKCLIPFALGDMQVCRQSEDMSSIEGRKLYIDAEFKADNGVSPLQEAAKQGHVGIVATLLDSGEPNILIPGGILTAIVTNEDDGPDIMACLLGREGVRAHITTEVVIAAAGNRRCGEQLMVSLLMKQNDKLLLIPRSKKYICKFFGVEVVQLITDLEVTADMIMAAATNRQYWKEVVLFLLQRSEMKTLIAKRVMFRAIDDWRLGKKVMLLVLEECGGQIQLIRAIVEAAARKWEDGEEAMSLLLSQERKNMEIEADAVTSICERFDADIVKQLFKNWGDNIKITNETIQEVCLRFDFEILQLLLENKDPQPDDVKNAQKALLFAAEFGKTATCEILLSKYQLDINYQDHLSRTALSYAAESGLEEIVAILLSDNRLQVNSQDYDGWTALLFAVWNGYHTIVQRLLAVENLDINSRDVDKRTAFIFAAWNGDTAMIRLLQAQKGLDVNCQDIDGRSALFYAAYFGHKDTVRHLLEIDNININARDCDDRAALDCVRHKKNRAIFHLLMDRLVPGTKNNEIQVRDKDIAPDAERNVTVQGRLLCWKNILDSTI
ncbi:hypothetical protein BDV26DRAFT_289364 [Aspergillus bertholletiae]|uniref:Ankyrin repeat-containing domain protein n=1 Tax=Aspergillus bertholletiae TaxID=1226010 RepID=A0A5N7BI79_9EURO|nr:hypothetical protein BDV26DRAFT_289364 [Aspergillus bertholletiae]